MAHDQRMKELIREFVEWFLQLIIPDMVDSYDLSSPTWLTQEVFSDPPTGTRRLLDLVFRVDRKQARENGPRRTPALA